MSVRASMIDDLELMNEESTNGNRQSNRQLPIANCQSSIDD